MGRAIWAARLATSWASAWGVVTTTASPPAAASGPSEDLRHPRSRRHVDEQQVELAPVDVLQELLERPWSIGRAT